jgi:ABC-type nickel/cobalt efflux system permease component RcnA
LPRARPEFKSHAVFATLAITGFGVAFFHAAIPTHWLPFVLTARVQRWDRAKTILVTAFAGSGHVLATAILGLGITWFGTALSNSIGDWFPRIAGGALLLFGLYYVTRQLRGRGHVHFPYPHEHLHESQGETHADHDHDHHHGHSHDDRPARGPTSDRAAILSLLAFLTLSPCEGFLPFYVSGIRYGWSGFAILTLILSVATVLGMVLFTSLTLIGLGKIKLGLLEKYESLVMGLLLCVVGLLILFFEH